MEKLKSRKFWMGVILSAIFIVMRIFDRLGDKAFVDLMIAVFGIYSASNVATKFVNKGGD